jgi:3-mercaptopyruvate sulfurtransferase SseA
MRVSFLSATIILVGAIILGGCNSGENKASDFAQADNKSKPAPTTPGDSARRITVTEAKDILDKGQAVVIDVRNQEAYDQGHIRSSKLIPAGEILNHIDELPRDKTIITYCS